MKLIASLLIGCVLFVGCATNNPAATPGQKKNLQAIELLTRVQEFQDTVGSLYDQKAVTPGHAVLYIRFTISAAKVLRDLPLGWQQLVKDSWNEVKTIVPITQMEVKVQVGAKLIDGLVGAL